MQSKFSLIIKELVRDIGKFYPFFLFFYVVAIFVTHVSHVWDKIFYWPAFHTAVGFMTFVAIVYYQSKIKEISKKSGGTMRGGYKSFSTTLKNYASKTLFVINFIETKIIDFLWSLGWLNYLKIMAVMLIVGYASIKGTDPFSLLVLGYGLASVFWILESRIAASLALGFLIIIPVLLAFKASALAELIAVFAYYFLVITVVTQIREYKRDQRRDNNKIAQN